MRYVQQRLDNSELRQKLRAIAVERRSFSYRRLGIMLTRKGCAMSHKRLLRLYPAHVAQGEHLATQGPCQLGRGG